jgi:ubiquinone/menaquinone biosynthesis C-methylase UbiE
MIWFRNKLYEIYSKTIIWWQLRSVKKISRNFLSKYGYEIKRNTQGIKDDKELYLKNFEKDSIKNKKFYNIGAGSFNHPFWTNIDYNSDWYLHNKNNTNKSIQYDLLSLKKIPVDSNSAEIVYTSHTIEHVTDKAAQFIFNEVHRILKANGIFRLTTPNIELAYRAFRKNDVNYFHNIYRFSLNPIMVKGVEVIKEKLTASIEQLFLFHFASSISTLHNFGEKKLSDNEIRKIFDNMDMAAGLDYCTNLCSIEIQKKYLGHHINWWTKEKIFRMLQQAGFKKIFLSGYGQSFSPVLRNTNYFDNTHPEMSVYVEAQK